MLHQTRSQWVVVPGQVKGENVSLQQVIGHHVVHDWGLSTRGDAGVGQAQDAVKLGYHKVLAWLVGAQSNLLVGDLNASHL